MKNKSILLTLITSRKPSVCSKRLSLDPKGGIKSVTIGNVSEGDLEIISIDTPEQFSDLLLGLKGNQCLVYGIPTHQASKLVTEDVWIDAGRPKGNLIPRTKECFEWASGSGILMLDIDAPKDLSPVLTKDEILRLLDKVLPGRGLLWWPSTSSCIYQNELEIVGLKGQRVYLMVQDARDIPRAGKVLNDRLWSLGYGRYGVTASGALREYGVFDSAVWQPNRIDFAGGAICTPPLNQRRGCPEIRQDLFESPINSRIDIPDLTAVEIEACRQHKASAKEAKQAEAARVNMEYVTRRVVDIQSKNPNISESEARNIVDSAVKHQQLWGDLLVTIKGIGPVSVHEILEDPDKYHTKITLDPVEPDYDGGRYVGILYLDDSRPILYSQAHGGTTYHLNRFMPANDFETIRREEQRKRNEEIGEGITQLPVVQVLNLREMLDRFIFLTDGSRVADRLHPHYDMAFPDFAGAYAASIDWVMTNNGMKPIPITTMWKRDPYRLGVITRTFKAGAGEFVDDPEGKPAFNTWQPFVRGVVEADEVAASMFVDHVRWLWGNRSDEFLDWLAHIEQVPGVLPHTAWLHIGDKTGLGRNWVAGVLARVWKGAVAPNFNLIQMLNSGFNGRISRKVLIIVDELREGGSGNRWEHSEKMKSIINEEIRSINPKYGRTYVEFNAGRWLMFSNHVSAIPLDDTDRRIQVVRYCGLPRNRDYYKNLYEVIDNPSFIEGVAKFLATRNLSSFNPGVHALKTQDKQQVIDVNKTQAYEACELISRYWPSDVVLSKDVLDIIGWHADDGRSQSSIHYKHIYEDLNFHVLKNPIWIDKSVRVTIIRNVEKWKDLPAADLAAELKRGNIAMGDHASSIGGPYQWLMNKASGQ